MEVDFLIDSLKRHTDRGLYYEATQRGIIINEDFINELWKLDNYKIRTNDWNYINILLENFKKGQHLGHVEFYTLFSQIATKLMNGSYSHFKNAHEERLRTIDISIYIHKYDYYFHCLEDRRLVMNDKIRQFHVLSPQLLIVLLQDGTLNICDLKPRVIRVNINWIRRVLSHYLLIEDKDGQIEIIDCKTWNTIFKTNLEVSHADILPDGRFICTRNGKLEIWNSEDLIPEQVFDDVTSFYVIDKRIAIRSEYTVKILNLETQTFDVQINSEGRLIHYIEVLSHNRILTIHSKEINIWDTNTGKLITSIPTNYEFILIPFKDTYIVYGHYDIQIVGQEAKHFTTQIHSVLVLPNNEVLIFFNTGNAGLINLHTFEITYLPLVVKGIFQSGLIGNNIITAAGNTIKIYG